MKTKKLERIQKGLEKIGIETKIEDMSLSGKEEKSREEVIEEIKGQERELKSWIEKEDWTMVAILNNRIRRNVEKILEEMDKE